MGAQGINRDGNTALHQIDENPVGVSYGDVEPLCQLLGGDFVGIGGADTVYQFLNSQGGGCTFWQGCQH